MSRPKRLHNQFRNALFFGLLAAGSYLSMAAIAAIPGLQEGEAPKEVGTDKLREKLAEASISDEFIKALLPDSKRNASLFGEPDGVVLRHAVAAPMDTSPSTISGLQTEEEGLPSRQMHGAQVWRESLLAQWDALGVVTAQQQKEAINAAVAAFEEDNLNRKGMRETIEHFQELGSWFRSYMAPRRQQLYACVSGVAEFDFAWRQSLAGAGLRKTSDVVANPAASDTTETDPSHADVYNKASWACEPAFDPWSDLPKRHAAGEHLGTFFGAIARWLLETESLPLALITGLVGFGLLGAACSRFVRERPANQEVGSADTPALVEDLAAVVIAGVSAAVVIFLAFKGGLSIVATNGSEPNPYLLLFMCLVASAFSEDVWRWAHMQLSQRLSGQSETLGAQTANGTGAHSNGDNHATAPALPG